MHYELIMISLVTITIQSYCKIDYLLCCTLHLCYLFYKWESVQFSCSVVSDSLRPHAHQPSLSITNSWSLFKIMSIALVMPSNHLILCHPLSSSLQSFPASGSFPMSRFSFLCIRWPKYWSFNFSISPSSEYSGLISFRIDGLDHLAVQGILKSLLQHHSSKASILGHSAFFIVQLSHP